MICLILAGGRGVRLWPESTEARPKQLCKFFGDKSMLEHTIERTISVGARSIIIITSKDQVEAITRVVRQNVYDNVDIIGEPQGKNTAPAVGLAISRYLDSNPQDVIAVFPSDHFIGDIAAFKWVISRAAKAAEAGYLVTIGIKPSYPETGYGYIQAENRELPELEGVYKVVSFKEKPDLVTAEHYIKTGGYYWNAGIFLGRVDVFAREFARHLPEVYQFIEKGFESYLESYESLPEISIDYGIAEKSKRVAVVPGDFGWSDVGSWKALAELLEGDKEGNVLLGPDVVAVNTYNCLVKQNSRTVALLGVRDLVVVETPDVVMVCHKDEAQKVRILVEVLSEMGKNHLL